MSSSSRPTKYSFLWLGGLGTALLIAGLLSPFASSNPDGLDRVAQDHGFDHRAEPHPPAIDYLSMGGLMAMPCGPPLHPWLPPWRV